MLAQTHRRTNVRIVAVEDGLIAARALRDLREGLDYAETEFLALHLTGNGNILDMPNAAEPAQKFALNKDATGANDLIGLARDNDKDIVRPRLFAHGSELRCPRLCAHVRCLREHGEHGEMAAPVIGRS